MTDDSIVRILSQLEEAPAVRPAFAKALRDQLIDEIGLRDARQPGTARAGRATDRRWPRMFRPASLRPVTWRGVLIAVVLILLLAALAAAAGLVITRWLSAGPSGPQFTDDFSLAELYREPAALYGDLHATPAGETLLAIRQPVQWPGRDTPEAAVVRFEEGGDGTASPTVLLGFEQLRDPALWDPAADITAGAVSRSIGADVFDALSVAPNGDLFLAASLFPRGLSQMPGSTSVLQIRPDGSVHRVVTGSELIASGLFDRLDEVIGIEAIASAPDLLWGRVEAPVTDPPGAAWWLFQVVDPNADGDWSDRIIRPLMLPDSVPQVEYGVYERAYGGYVAEPSTDGSDRSRSILLPVLDTDGRLTIHRLTDTQGDGDLTDPGEAELVFDGLTSSDAAALGLSPAISPRVVAATDGLVIDELVAGGLSRSSRVSRITPDGIVDIVRALPTWADDVEADRQGAIYVATQAAGEVSEDPGGSELPQFLLYRLDPVRAGSGASAMAASTPSSSSAPTWSPTPPPRRTLFDVGPVTDGVPAIAFRAYGDSDPSDDDPNTDAQQAFRIGIDGSGPEQIIAGDMIYGFCQSADGSLVAARAETPAVPGEPFVWVADAAGGEPALVSETANAYWCGFPPDAMLLASGMETADRHQTVVRHDLATGEETVLAEDVLVLGLTADGMTLAVADDTTRSSLTVVDVSTGERRVLDAPGGPTVRAAWWAPGDGAIAWLTGVPPGPDPAIEDDWTLRVVDLVSGSTRELLTFHGREPEVSWSEDGTHLLLRAPTSHHATFVLETPEGPLWLVDVVSGEVETVVADGARWAGWSPVEPATYAYADTETLTVADLDGSSRRLLDRPKEPLCAVCDLPGQWPVAHWLGWSPDGSFIGLGKYSGAIAAVAVVSGGLRVPIVSGPHFWIDEPRWWH